MSFAGGVMSSAESLEYILQKYPKGRIIGIVIGGSAEVLEAHMGRHATILSKRRGFCKYALKYGTWLVPSYSFGENDIFIQIRNRKGSLLRRIQDTIKHHLGFCPPIYFGRGLFNSFFGLLPFRRPITTVVGRPIPVQKSKNGEPTQDEIEKLHATYTRELIKLFEEHKENYGVAPDQHLEIL
ncbi:Diacylglycerol acyltransferase [Aphelenchoides bicaudatus]|nr:Diacylglycerol acyltransferase [Aphelenchoides bicaudatus]